MSDDDKDKEASMDAKRKKIADNVIRKMVDKGASGSEVAEQQKKNKELLGHEGDVN